MPSNGISSKWVAKAKSDTNEKDVLWVGLSGYVKSLLVPCEDSFHNEHIGVEFNEVDLLCLDHKWLHRYVVHEMKDVVRIV